MSLASLKYILFLAATAVVYLIMPKKLRKYFLLAAAYGFYCLWSPVFSLLLMLATAVSWGCAILYERRALGCGGLWIWLGALYLFGMLFLFKYLDFFVNTILSVTGKGTDFESGLLMPVGISFYTFSTASYLFDVKKGRMEAEGNIPDYALFAAFLPAILSGPINRAPRLLPQIKEYPDISYTRLKRGFLRFCVGAAKKLVLADTLGLFVNAIYADIPQRAGGVLAMAAAAYSLQIYFDFAGYTDMALGAADALGFRLGENFHAPYLVTSVKEFWKNWHISLTSWFRDYLYFPLGGSRCSKGRTYLNVLIVFAVSGLWHGADASFIIWGLLNGLYQVIEQMLDPIRIKKKSVILSGIRCLITFILITVAWIFFRANTTSDALLILKKILLIPVSDAGSASISEFIQVRQLVLAGIVTFIFALDDLHLVRRGSSVISGMEEKSLPYWLTVAMIAVVIVVFGMYGGELDSQSFVYFNF